MYLLSLVFIINLPGTTDENLPEWLNLAHLHSILECLCELVCIAPFKNKNKHQHKNYIAYVLCLFAQCTIRRSFTEISNHLIYYLEMTAMSRSQILASVTSSRVTMPCSPALLVLLPSWPQRRCQTTARALVER